MSLSNTGYLAQDTKKKKKKKTSEKSVEASVVSNSKASRRFFVFRGGGFDPGPYSPLDNIFSILCLHMT